MDRPIKSRMLYQLSYAPVCGVLLRQMISGIYRYRAALPIQARLSISSPSTIAPAFNSLEGAGAHLPLAASKPTSRNINDDALDHWYLAVLDLPLVWGP